MMNLVFSIILLIIALLAYLLIGLNSGEQARAKSTSQNVTNSKEITALISQFEQNKANLADLPTSTQSAQLSELEARLYQELKPLIHHTPRDRAGPPIWAYIVIVLMVFSAVTGWYFHGGHYVLQWQKLDRSMDSALTRSQFLDELPKQVPAEAMSTYCLALQNRIDRNDLNQLDTLAQCVASYGNYATARNIYQQIYRKSPSDVENTINYAQMSLFSQQGQPLSQELEKSLTHIWLENPSNYLAGILLASSYTQAAKDGEAALIWQQLLHTMPKDHPLYELVEATYQRRNNKQALQSNERAQKLSPTSKTVLASPELNITINMPQQMIDSLPSQSRLFVLATPRDSRMPIAVKRLALAQTQTLTLTNQDSMQGQSLTDYDSLNVVVIISKDGQADGEAVTRQTQVINIGSSKSPVFDLTFDFIDDAAS